MVDCKVEVRGPDGGYDIPEKENYRNAVWSVLAPATKRFLSDDRAVWLILPSREGLEIEVAVKFGIPPERIVCVDKSAALIATSKWRKTWPQCRFYACDVADVGEKLKRDGLVIAGANLDLCGNFSEENISTIEGFVSNAPRFDGGAVCITMMKGREGAALFRLLDKMNGDLDLSFVEEKRIKALLVCSDVFSGGHWGNGFRWSLIGQGSYIASRMPVAWVVLQAESIESLMPNVNPLADKVDKAGLLINKCFDARFEDGVSNERLKRSFNRHWKLRHIRETIRGQIDDVIRELSIGSSKRRVINESHTSRAIEILLNRRENDEFCIANVRKTWRGWGIY